MAKLSKLIIFSAWLVILPPLAFFYPAAAGADWSAPSLSPTSVSNLAISNSLPPIDIGAESQTKWGALSVGGNFRVGGLTNFLNMTGVGNWFATLANAPQEMLDVDGIVRANDFCLRKQTDGSPDTNKCLSGLFAVGGSSGTGLFSSRVDYTAGAYPIGVAIADLNGDGRSDIAVVNQSSNTVSVFLNNGNGTFAPKVDYGTGLQPFNVAIADLNGDGRPDIVVTNASSNTISVLMNNGNGTFAPKVDYPTGQYPLDVALADLNGDGRPDIVVTNNADSTVSVFLNNGNGTFAPKVDYPTGTYTYSVAIADLNSDGKPDIVVTNSYLVLNQSRGSGDTISVLMNNGNGTFAPKVDYPTGQYPLDVALADLNGDGRSDIAVVNQSSNTVSVFLNNGNGTFAPKVDYPTGQSPAGIALADLTGDGKIDMAVTEPAGVLSVFANNGNGTFAPKVDYPTGQRSWDIALADLNIDRRVDAVVTNTTNNTVSVFLNQGTFTPASGGSSSSAGVTSLTAGTNISLSPANPLNSTNPTGTISATPKTISCPSGQALVSISQTGAPNCAALPPAGSATSPVTGLTSADNSVSIFTTPSPPYSSTAPGIQVNRSVIQARVTGSCQGSGGMTSVGSDGSVSCAPYPSCSISGKTITCGATSVTSQ